MNKRDYFFSSNGRKIFVLLITVIFILAGAVGISAVYADGESSTSGNVSYAAKWNDAGSAVKLTVTPKNAGTVYYLMQDSGETAPSEDSVKSNKSLDCTAGQNTTIEITSSDKKAKDIYVIYQETGSDSSYEMSKMTLPAYDSVSKTGSVSISAERNGSDKLSLSVTPTIDGTLKYIVKGASEDAPSDDDFNSASSISESANTTKTKQISLGDDPTAAKKVYLCYYTDDAVFVETAVMDIPALDSTSFKAEITPSELNLGTVLEGYKASDKAAVATISNTGSGTVSFSVDTTADGYDNFSKYFDVDTSGVEVIASGKQGSITVTPKEGLAAGTYSGTFYLVDKIDKDNTLTLGPVAVKMTIAKKGDGTVEGVRTPEGEYTPSVNKDGDLSEIKIDGRVAYCVNYYYTIDSSDNSWMNVLYKNKFGEIPDSTNKELDSYTGLNPNSDPVVYPPNNYNYTPVKEGSSNSTVRDNVAKVLYYGYPNDALGLRSRGGTIWNDNNYRYVLIEKDRKDLAFEIATQCAIWHYTDGIDFSNINSSSETDPRVRHVWGIYSSLTDWGWEDVQNLYNFLVGTTDKGLLGRGKFYGNATYPSNLPDAPDNFAVDLFVADNPVVKPESSLGEWAWAQNLATYSTTTPDTTTDVSITKIWADQSNADGNRPAAGTFKSWIHLYDGDENVTTTYADNLSITDNGNNTYTVTYKDLPKEGHTYKIEEVIPEEYKDNYKIPESKNSAVNGGSIKNYAPTENTDYDSLTINKEDDKGNVLEGAIFTLYSDSDCNNEITNLTKTDGNGNVTINTDASYLKDHLPTENNGTTKVYLKETTPPTGYTASDTVYTIVLGTKISSDWNSNNTAYVTTTSYTIKYLDGEKQKDELTVKNQPVTKNEQAYETLTIYKVSDAGTALSGAQFTLFSDKQCSTPVTGVTAFVTGEGGTIEINSKDLIDKQLSDDTYYLKETGVPQGYTGSDKVYEIVLDTTVSSAWNSDNTAYVTTTTHTIRCNDSKELRVRNTKKDATVKNSELTIMKSDADTSAALRGATFALYEDEAAKTKIEGSDITTDSNGQAYINTSADYLKNYLPKEDGTKTIYLKETEAPDGYQLSDTVYQIDITRSTEGNVTTYTIKSKNDSSSSSTLSVVDKPISIDKKTNDSTITVKKVDGDNKLSGAVFTLYSDYGCTTEITDLPSTDENGKVTISTSAEFLKNFLPSNNGGARSIYLKETKAPIGYKLNNKVYTLTLNTSVTTELNSDKTAKIETTTYSITCEDLNEDSKEITVSDQPVVFDLTVNKMWADDLNGQQETVTVQLTKNGTGTDQKVTLNETNHWTATFTDLRKYDESGNEITYGVIEIDGDKHYNVSYYQSDSSHIVVYNKAKTIELHTTVAVDNINSSSDKALSVDCMNLTRNIVDTVSYSGLDTTKTYTVVGRLVDVTDVNNEEIITQASEVFQPEAEKEKGSIGVDFGKVSLEAGHKYVVYEYLYTGEISNQEQNDKDKKLPDETPTAEHHDNNDKAQTFVVKEETPTPTPETPSISTTVSADGESSTSEKAVETSSTSVNVIDKVTYKNLTAGTEYTLQGQLMDVTDKDNIVSVGDAKTETFTPSESNGTQDIDLGTLDLKPGHTYVVYETLYKGSEAEGTPVAEHKDKDDKAQTVVVKEETSTTPSISTTVSANGEPSSSTKPVEANRIRVKVVDKVFYENLTVGKEYTVKGQLMDITDRDNVISVGDAHTTTFTPTESSGTVNVDFGTMKLTPGHTYVIHETLYEGAKASGTSVFVHDDNDNKAQTVIVKSDASISKSDYPSIRTTISADGEKSTSKKAVSTEKTRVHVVDKVYYNNLTLGETYTLKGKLIDLTSGDTVVKTASMTFTAKKSDGYVKLDFGRVTVEPGHKYVAFEYLYDGAKAEGSPVAEHKDKNEKSQTIIATGTANTRTSNGNGNGNGGNGNGTGSNNGNGVRTGDNASLIWGVVLAGTVAALLIVIRKRRSSER